MQKRTIILETKIQGIPEVVQGADQISKVLKSLKKERAAIDLNLADDKTIKRYDVLTKDISNLTGELSANRKEARANAKAVQLSAEAASAAVGSYDELSAKTRELTLVAKQLGDNLTQTEFENLQKQIGNTVEGFDQLTLAEANAGKANELLQTKINSNNEELRDFNRNISGANQLVGEYDRALLDVLAQAQNGGIGLLSKRFDTLTAKEKELTEETQRLVNELDKVDEGTEDFKKLQAQLNATATELQSVQSEAAQVNKSIEKIGDNTAFGKVKNSIGGFLSELKAGFAFSIADNVSQQVQQVLSDTGEAIRELQALGAGVENVLGDSTDNVEATTAKAAAIIRQFDTDSKELLRSTNSVTEAFGNLGADEALTKTRDLFIQIGDINPEILAQIDEYAPLLEKAGFSADEFFALIRAQSEEGISKDKLLDSLKEFDLSLTEFTDTQKKALAPLGEAFVTDVAKRIDEGSLTVRDAFFEIQEQSQKMGLSVSEQQGIIAGVFKGAGEDAGGFAKIMNVVNGAINNTEVSLTSYQKTQLRLNELNEKLATTQGELAKELLGTAASYDELGVRAKIFATEALRDLTISFKSIQERFQKVNEAQERFRDVTGKSAESVEGLDETVKKRRGLFDIITNGLKTIIDFGTKSVQTLNGFGAGFTELFNQVTSLTFDSAKIGEAFDQGFNKGVKGAESATAQVLGLNESIEATRSQLAELEQQRSVDIELGVDTAELDKQIAAKRVELDNIQKSLPETLSNAPSGPDENPFKESQTAIEKLVTTAAKIKFDTGSLDDLNGKLSKAEAELNTITNTAQRVKVIADIEEYKKDIALIEQQNKVITESLSTIEIELGDNLFENLALAREQLAELQANRAIAIEAGIDPANIDQAIAELERIQAALPSALEPIALNFDITESDFTEAADKVSEQISAAINSEKPQQALSELLEQFQEQLDEKDFEFFTEEELEALTEGLDISLTDIFALDEDGLEEFKERIQEAFNFEDFSENSEEAFAALQELLVGVTEDAEAAGQALQLDQAIEKTEGVRSAIGSLSSAMQSLTGNIDKSSQAGRAFEKVTLALAAADKVAAAVAQVMAVRKQAQAAAEASSAVAKSAGTTPFPGNLIAIASIVGALLSAFSSIKGAFAKGEEGGSIEPTPGIQGGKLHTQGGNKYKGGYELERDEGVVQMKNRHGRPTRKYVFSRKTMSDPVLRNFLHEIGFQAIANSTSRTPAPAFLESGGVIPIPTVPNATETNGSNIVVNNTGISATDVQNMIDAQQEKIIPVLSIPELEANQSQLQVNQTAFNP